MQSFDQIEPVACCTPFASAPQQYPAALTRPNQDLLEAARSLSLRPGGGLARSTTSAPDAGRPRSSGAPLRPIATVGVPSMLQALAPPQLAQSYAPAPLQHHCVDDVRASRAHEAAAPFVPVSPSSSAVRISGAAARATPRASQAGREAAPRSMAAGGSRGASKSLRELSKTRDTPGLRGQARLEVMRQRSACYHREFTALRGAFPQIWTEAMRLHSGWPKKCESIRIHAFYKDLPHDAFVIANLDLVGPVGCTSPRRVHGRHFLANPLGDV